MDEYFCPNCGATLNDQYGFDPDNGSWTCTSCGMHLMDDDVYEGDTYEGVAWYCDDCGALLNRQPGFSDSGDSWQCTQCGHVNGTTDADIINDGPQCPNCSSYLKRQSYYGGYEDDWTCEDCGAKLHRDYSCDSYEVVHEEEGPICPCCGDRLNSQSYYNKHEDDWTCEACGAKLHRTYYSDPYEEVCEDDDDNDDDCNYTPPSYIYEKQKDRCSEYTRDSGNQQVKVKSATDEELRKVRIKAFIFKRKKVQIGYDHTDLLHKNYDYVRSCLKNQAFKNIKCVPIKDIHMGSPYSVGEVEQIVLNGSQYFAANDMVAYDTEIVITYHDKKEITVPFNARICRKKQYTEIGDQLQELGFTEIYERPIQDLTTGWILKDGSIEKVIIDGNDSFKKNSVYEYDTKIVIEYHTFKKK